MIGPLIALFLFKFGCIPKTEPHVVKKFKLRELQKLPRDWENDDITTHGVISLMNEFSRVRRQCDDSIVFTPFGIKTTIDIFRKYIGGETGKDLLIISKRCITDAFIKRFRLDDLKTILENWKGENVVEVQTILSHYTCELESFTEEEEDELKLTGFFEGVEDLFQQYLGVENYKTLDIMVVFFEKMDILKRELCAQI